MDIRGCDYARQQFALMLYGELSFDEEERVEAHLDTCAECRRALARQKDVHEAVSAAGVTPSPALLSESRAVLNQVLQQNVEQRPGNWWHQFAGSFRIRFVHPLLQPAAALALLATGFFGAKLLPAGGTSGFGEQASLLSSAGLGSSRVHNVATDAAGRVRIDFDQTQQRTLTGQADDQEIRALLVAAAKYAPEAEVRARTVTILSSGAAANEVRQVLVFALANDRSDSVRAVALQSLRPYAQDPAVRNALTQVLLGGGSTRFRTQAVDMLSSHSNVALDREAVGALQELMDHEEDNYVRDQCRRMLEALKASPETY